MLSREPKLSIRTLATPLALLLLFGLLVTAPRRAAEAAFPGLNGRIAYTGAKSNDFDIYSVEAAGGVPTNLTNTPTERENDPVWSPRGTEVAFSRANDIWVMNGDGSEAQNLTPAPNDGDGNAGRWPAWSPDGTRIAYGDGGEIWTMAADGGDKQDLSTTPATEGVESDPTYSPDGTQVAYTRGLDLWVMNEDGTEQKPLLESTNKAERSADWSPDGSTIVLERSGEIWTIGRDGSGAAPLVTTAEGGGTGPAFSPDGSRVVFSSSGFGAQNGPDIITIRSDGSDAARVAGTAGLTDFEPNWQPVVDDVDLNVQVTDTPDPVPSGDNLTYVATVTNQSDADARLVALTSLLPTRATFVSVDPSQGSCTKKQANLSCKLGPIAHGGDATVTVVVSPTSPFDLAYGVSVSSSQPDPDHWDNAFTATTTVLPPPDPGPQAFLTWTVPDRFKDYDGDNMLDENLFNNPKAAVIPFEMILQGCDSPFEEVTNYAFEVTLPDGQVLEQSSPSCDFQFQPPKEGKYPVKLTVTASDGSTLVTEQEVPFRDFFIVSIGDSVASGEGNPDKICAEGCHKWDRPATWQNRPCHRSAISGPSRAAWNIEASDPTTSVTFTHLACSGGKATAGILDEYAGIEPNGDQMIPPQAKVLATLMKQWGRKPDAVLMSIGANDAQFADALIDCLLWGKCQNNKELVAKVERLLRTLPNRYSRLDQMFDDLNIPGKNVFITEYFDPSKDQRGRYVECQPQLFASEWQWAANNVLGPLNDHVRRAQERHGWNLVGGIASAYERHGYCSTDSWVVDIGQSIDWQGNEFGAFHPNVSGHVLYGNRIATVLRRELSR